MYFDAFAFTFDNSLVLEKGEVLGNRSLGKSEALPDMFDIAFLGAESGNNLQPYRMTKHFANLSFAVETSIFVELHTYLHFAKKMHIYIYSRVVFLSTKKCFFQKNNSGHLVSLSAVH